MKKCCCCIPLVGGAIILTILAFLISSIQLGALFPYILKVDPETFNPIERNLNGTLELLKFKLKEFEVKPETVSAVVENIRKYIGPFLIGKLDFGQPFENIKKLYFRSHRRPLLKCTVQPNSLVRLCLQEDHLDSSQPNDANDRLDHHTLGSLRSLCLARFRSFADMRCYEWFDPHYWWMADLLLDRAFQSLPKNLQECLWSLSGS